MRSRKLLIAGSVLLLGAAFARRSPDVIEIHALVDGRLPDSGAHTAFGVAGDRGFTDPVSTVDWLECEVWGGMLQVTLRPDGREPGPATCREGDREVPIVFHEKPLWSKVLDTRGALRTENVNVLAVPERTHIARLFSVERGGGLRDALPEVGLAGLECTPRDADGASVSVKWISPASTVHTTCWVEPEGGDPYPLVFALSPAPSGG